MLTFVLLAFIAVVARTLRSKLAGVRFLVSSNPGERDDHTVSADELHRGVVSTWRWSRVFESALWAACCRSGS